MDCSGVQVSMAQLCLPPKHPGLGWGSSSHQPPAAEGCPASACTCQPHKGFEQAKKLLTECPV
eukprot:scaffold23687_cov19-Tisochrysis_lutea.AAC.1